MYDENTFPLRAYTKRFLVRDIGSVFYCGSWKLSAFIYNDGDYGHAESNKNTRMP